MKSINAAKTTEPLIAPPKIAPTGGFLLCETEIVVVVIDDVGCEGNFGDGDGWANPGLESPVWTCVVLEVSMVMVIPDDNEIFVVGIVDPL